MCRQKLGHQAKVSDTGPSGPSCFISRHLHSNSSSLTFNASLKLTWFRRLVAATNTRCYNLFNTFLNLEKLFNCGKYYIDVLLKQVNNCFWNDVLSAYSNLIDSMYISTIEECLDMPLFYNHNFLIDKKPLA